MKTTGLALLVCTFFVSTRVFGGSLRVEEVEFASQGVTLAGSIVFPVDQPTHAAVVFIHGSGKQTRNIGLAERFAKEGIATLVYDKRGAGKSGGDYEGDQSVSEKNIALLADDAAAALEKLSSLPSLKRVPVGFAGISQAGWIAPVAAKKSSLAKFLVLWSGPVSKVSEEDIYSKYTADRDSPVAPSYEEALRSRTATYVWPDFLGKDTDSSETLQTLSIPGLWLFSDNDGSIPVDLSISRLHALRKAGHAYDYVLFGGLGHNNMDRTFATAVDWIKQVENRGLSSTTLRNQNLEDEMAVKSVGTKVTPEAQLQSVIEKLSPKEQNLFRSVRSAVRKRLPTANELVYDYGFSIVISYSPSEHGIEGVLSIATRDGGLRLYLTNGPKLPDPKKLLMGSAKQVRYIPVESASRLKHPDVEALIAAAIDLAKVPLPLKGSGKVISKIAAEKKPAGQKRGKNIPARKR